jgi:hypothetical protein
MAWIKLIFAQAAFAATIGPTPFPVFLKEGFSTILEFEEAPTQVVLGDANVFQVEKLNRSIVIKPLVTYATTNMFVYFKTKDARLFILAASEDAEPTYYKKFESFVPKKAEPKTADAVQRSYSQGAQLSKVSFDAKKDFLTIDIVLSAGPKAKVVPNWDLVRLRHKGNSVSPTKLWSERREAQKDSAIKARFIFAKPNVPGDLKEVALVIPLKGSIKPFSIAIRRPRS